MRDMRGVVVLVFGALLLWMPSVMAGNLLVQDLRWRGPLPGQTVAAIYVSLTNSGSTPLTLSGVTLEGARKAEFHTHIHDQGMMRMRRLEQLELGPGETVNMAPGGLHIMVFGVVPEVDDRQLTLMLLSGDEVKISISEASR